MVGEEGRYGQWEREGIVPREVFAAAGAGGFLGMAVGEPHGGAGAEDFRLNLVIGEECQRAAVGSFGLGITLHNDICLPYFLTYCDEAQSDRWLPRDRHRRADHRTGDDRAGNRLGPRGDVHDGPPRRRPLHRQRLEDIHHQRHQRGPGDPGGEDRPLRAPPRHQPDDRGARHGGLRARPEPREDRPARPGHRRAVLHRRPRAGREPARRRGPGLPLSRLQPPSGAPLDRGLGGGRGRGRPRLDARLRT